MFIDWLNDQLRERGWKQADLAKFSHLDTSYISNLINGKRNPGPVACKALASALRIPLDTVYQAAGLLRNPKPDNDGIIEEITDIYTRLDDDNRIDALEYFRLRLRIQEERASYNAKPHEVKK